MLPNIFPLVNSISLLLVCVSVVFLAITSTLIPLFKVILSVVMPKFVKDETDKAVLGIGLSAFLLGAFVCGLIDTFVN